MSSSAFVICPIVLLCHYGSPDFAFIKPSLHTTRCVSKVKELLWLMSVLMMECKVAD